MLRKLKYLVIAMCKNLNNVTEPLKGQVNWPPETSIFTRFLKNYFLTNFDIVVHSAYLVDAQCGTPSPKYFDGASSLVWDLRAQYQNWRSPGTLCVYVYRVFCQKLCSVSFRQVWLRFYILFIKESSLFGTKLFNLNGLIDININWRSPGTLCLSCDLPKTVQC